MINKWTATLSVNAGLSLKTKGLRIWIDALHKNKVPDFSTLTPERQRLFFECPDFKDPDVIFFSHCHPDHYSRELTEKAIKMYPDARLIMPRRDAIPFNLPEHLPIPDEEIPGGEGEKLLREAVYGEAPSGDVDRQILIEGQEMILSIREHQLIFHRLVHEGEHFRNVPNYALMIEDGADRILVLGDSALSGEGLLEWTDGKSIDTVFVPFPWITLDKPGKLLLEKIRPDQVMVYHLPLIEDDLYGYVKAARKAAMKLEDRLDIRLMTEAFQSEEL